jgi:hypothetical protein
VTIRDGRVDIALPDVNGLAAATSPEPEITCIGLAQAGADNASRPLSDLAGIGCR